MIIPSILTLLSLLQALPCEYVVDFGPAAVPFEYKMRIDLVARDGTALEMPIVWSADADAKGNRDTLVALLKGEGWVAWPGPDTSFIVIGTKKLSPVKSVTVKSQATVPTVRWVPLSPKPAKEPKK